MRTTEVEREFETPIVEPQRIAVPIEVPEEAPIQVDWPVPEPAYIPVYPEPMKVAQ